MDDDSHDYDNETDLPDECHDCDHACEGVRCPIFRRVKAGEGSKRPGVPMRTRSPSPVLQAVQENRK